MGGEGRGREGREGGEGRGGKGRKGEEKGRMEREDTKAVGWLARSLCTGYARTPGAAETKMGKS